MLFNHTDTYIGLSLELYGEFRKSEIAMLCQLIREGDVVIDAVATVGRHTMFFAGEVGDKGAYSHLSHSGLVLQALCANACSTAWSTSRAWSGKCCTAVRRRSRIAGRDQRRPEH